MSLAYAEVSGITSDEFDALFNASANLRQTLTVYRQVPAFDTNLGVIGGRPVDLPFSVCADDNYIVRAFNDGGTVKAERSADGITWSSPATVATSLTGVRPKLVVNSGYDLYLINATGTVKKYHSADGDTWDGGTSFSTVTLPVDGTLEAIGYADGIELIYAIIREAAGARHIIALDATTQYETGLYWPQRVWGFDVERLTLEEDKPGDADSAIRHILVMAAAMPALYVTKTVDHLPVKQAQLSGGLVSCVVRPPLTGRPLSASRWFPVEVSENTAATNRYSCHTMKTGDTLWVIASGFNGDINTTDIDYTYTSAFYYSTRDGKYWTQCRDTAWTGLGGTLPDLVNDSALARCGEHLYLLSCEGAIQSPGCLEFGNPMVSETLDITHYVLAHGMSQAETRQSTITLDNNKGQLNGTLLGSGVALGLITKVGDASHQFQVSIQEIDTIQALLERPREEMQVAARDRMAWLNDRSQSESALQWDSQMVAVDTYQDIAGMENSGLAHTATVKGTFATAANILKLKSKYKEGIAFKTEKSIIADGVAAASFSVPNPSAHGGTSAADSPTYAGVVFHALDKDNLVYCWYNRWTQKFEMGIRSAGVNTQWDTWDPSADFKTAANNTQTVALRVEFKGARIRVYEAFMVWPTGAQFAFSHEFVHRAHSEFNPVWLSGYVGFIGCGFSDEDDGSTTDPAPETVTVTGLPDGAFVPSDKPQMGILGNTDAAYGWKTSDFTGSTPHYGSPVAVSGSAGAAVYDATVDAFSPGYISGAGPVNLWVVEPGGIYYYQDMFGLPTRTLKHAWDHAASFITASVDASFGSEGWLLGTVSYRGATNGTYAVYSTDKGVTWHEVLITSFYCSNAAVCSSAMDQHNAGHAFALAYTSTDAWNAGVGIYETHDYGATWTPIAMPGVPGEFTGGLWMPYAGNDAGNILYYSSWQFWNDGGGGNDQQRLYRRTGTTWSGLLNPVASGINIGPMGRRELHVAPTNNLRMVAHFSAGGHDSSTHEQIFRSDNGGATWTSIWDRGIFSTNNVFYALAIAGDDPNTIYAWGRATFFVSHDAGATWLDKASDIPAVHGGGQPDARLIYGAP